LNHSAFQLLAVGGNCNKIYFISTNDLRVEVTEDIATIGVKKGRKLKNTGINSLSFHPTQLDILICKDIQ
jgi:aspartate oxidase